jgi:hypothetical protein
MAIWITDRTQSDVDRVNELHDKANVGTWTEEERIEWAAGMKGALSYMDYNRIESGVSELAATLGASVSIKTDWTVEGYMTASDASRWLSNVSNIRAKCSGPGGLPNTPPQHSCRFSLRPIRALHSPVRLSSRPCHPPF